MLSFEQNRQSGFDTAELSRLTVVKAIQGERSGIPIFLPESRLLIISNTVTTRDKHSLKKQNIFCAAPKVHRTNNRKTVTYRDSFTFENNVYRINNGNGDRKFGIYVETLKSILGQFHIARSLWRRVFIVRSELHLPGFTENSEIITAFRKRLVAKLKRQYGFKQVGYCWAREYHGKGKGQHYHFALMLDGNLIRHSSRVNEIIRESWMYGGQGYEVGTIQNPYYHVDKDDIAQEAIYRLSYLAKTRGKGYRPAQSKDFQCSRLKLR